MNKLYWYFGNSNCSFTAPANLNNWCLSDNFVVLHCTVLINKLFIAVFQCQETKWLLKKLPCEPIPVLETFRFMLIIRPSSSRWIRNSAAVVLALLWNKVFSLVSSTSSRTKVDGKTFWSKLVEVFQTHQSRSEKLIAFVASLLSREGCSELKRSFYTQNSRRHSLPRKECFKIFWEDGDSSRPSVFGTRVFAQIDWALVLLTSLAARWWHLNKK